MLRQQPLYELVGYRQPLKAAHDRAESGAEHPQQGPGTEDPKNEQQQLRRKINSRERKRMQDLNLAMDALREAILPYSAAHCQGSPGRKLSKIATLLFARNYILLLGSSLQELRRVIAEMGGSGGPRLLLAGLPLFAPGPLLLAPGTLSHPADSLRAPSKYLALEEQPCGPAHLPSAASLCPCALCKLPHCLPPGLGVAQFSK